MTFLPQFKMCVEAGTYSLMCSYNRYWCSQVSIIRVLLMYIVHVLSVEPHYNAPHNMHNIKVICL